MISASDLTALEGFSVNEVSALLHVEPKTIRREIYRGKLKAFRVGRAVRISRQSIEDYLKGV